MKHKYIDAGEAVKRCRDKAYPITLVDQKYYHGINGLSVGEINRIIDGMPAADVEPVRHGKWRESKAIHSHFWECSACKFPSEALAAPKLYKYCPNCGAKMDGGGEDD